MIPQIHRVRGSKAIAMTLSEGHRARSGPVQAAARPSEGGQPGSGDEEQRTPFRVAVVTTRGFENAVARNRARRRVKAAVWKCRDALREGLTYVVVARPGTESMPAPELEERTRRVLEKIGRVQG